MSLSFSSAIFLFAMGILGGTMNAVAGGGTFFVFPALLFTGVPPVPANATNTVALWPGLAAGVRAFWPRLIVTRRLLLPLVVISLTGGMAGAVLLIRTPAHIFMRMVPWLMLAATVLFALGPHLGRSAAGRGTAEGSAVLGVRIDPDARRAWHGDTELDLTTKEFDLLWILLRDAGKVVTREQIMREVWDAKWWTSTKTLDMHISWLRRKLGDDAHSPRYITTVRGVGFRFERGDKPG